MGGELHAAAATEEEELGDLLERGVGEGPVLLGRDMVWRLVCFAATRSLTSATTSSGCDSAPHCRRSSQQPASSRAPIGRPGCRIKERCRFDVEYF